MANAVMLMEQALFSVEWAAWRLPQGKGTFVPLMWGKTPLSQWVFSDLFCLLSESEEDKTIKTLKWKETHAKKQEEQILINVIMVTAVIKNWLNLYMQF